MAQLASITVETVAQCLADWHAELGYLEHADALQIVGDEFGDGFMWMDERGKRGIKPDVLAALRPLVPSAVWNRHFAPWTQTVPTALPARLSNDG